MVAVFLPVLPVGVVLSSHDVTRLSYVAFGTKKTKGGAGAGNILSHIGVHHTRYLTKGRYLEMLCSTRLNNCKRST